MSQKVFRECPLRYTLFRKNFHESLRKVTCLLSRLVHKIVSVFSFVVIVFVVPTNNNKGVTLLWFSPFWLTSICDYQIMEVTFNLIHLLFLFFRRFLGPPYFLLRGSGRGGWWVISCYFITGWSIQNGHKRKVKVLYPILTTISKHSLFTPHFVD